MPNRLNFQQILVLSNKVLMPLIGHIFIQRIFDKYMLFETTTEPPFVCRISYIGTTVPDLRVTLFMSNVIKKKEKKNVRTREMQTKIKRQFNQVRLKAVKITLLHTQRAMVLMSLCDICTPYIVSAHNVLCIVDPQMTACHQMSHQTLYVPDEIL